MFKSFLSEHSIKDYNFSSDLFPTIEDREFWDAFPDDDVIKQAEAALDFDWPIIRATEFMEFKKSGKRIETNNYLRRQHLVLFALAELKENKGRFLPQLTDGIFAICEETFWGLSAHVAPHNTNAPLEDIPAPDDIFIDLIDAETAEHLAIIARVLEKPLSEFCPRILERIDEELERRIRAPYLTKRDHIWMGYNNKKVNNWNPWIISNLLTVFLLTEKRPAKVTRAIEKMFIEIQYYYDTIPEDGGCEEGSAYYGHSGISLFEFLYQIKLATGGEIDIFSDEKIKLTATYAKKARMVSDIYINVGDSHSNGRIGFMLNVFAFGKETGQRDVMNMAATVFAEKYEPKHFFSHNLKTLRRIINHAKFFAEIKNFEVTYPINDTLELLPSLELAVLRRGDLTISFKGGHNYEGHGHNDVGTFALYDGISPIFPDLGINKYTRFTFDKNYRYTAIPWTRSAYHNLPMINGVEQKFGYEFKSDSFVCTEDELTISYPKAYPEEAGVNALTRSIKMTENELLINDRFEFSSRDAQKVTEVLMAVLPISLENNEVTIDGRFKISANAGAFVCEQVPFEDEGLKNDWNAEFCTRIMLDCDGVTDISIKVEKI